MPALLPPVPALPPFVAPALAPPAFVVPPAFAPPPFAAPPSLLAPAVFMTPAVAPLPIAALPPTEGGLPEPPVPAVGFPSEPPLPPPLGAAEPGLVGIPVPPAPDRAGGRVSELLGVVSGAVLVTPVLPVSEGPVSPLPAQEIAAGAANNSARASLDRNTASSRRQTKPVKAPG